MASLPPKSGQRWTDGERAEMRRLEVACQDFSHWQFECDHTDAGDPWCVVYDLQSRQTVLHIARIDRRYIVVCPPRQTSVWTTTIRSAIELALQEISTACCWCGEGN